MADDTEVLLKLHESQWDGIWQSEAQRTQITNIVLLIASADYGFIAQNGLGPAMLPLTILLVGLGIYGALASEKLYERWWFWRRRTEALEGRLDSLHPNAKLLKLWQDALSSQQKAFPRLFRLRLHYVWLALHLGIALSGVALTAIAAFGR